MLGLTRGTVRLAPHDERWSHAFDEERAALARLLGHVSCRIDHVGSTAVPRLRAKPILDVAVGLPPGADFDAVHGALTRGGYIYRGDSGPDGGHLFVRESAPDVRTHHVHVVRTDDPQWRRYLLFRDLLRRNPQAAGCYEREKLRLAAELSGDRRGYTAGKAKVIRELLAGAESPQTSAARALE